MSKQDTLKQAVRSYPDERAKNDELFAVSYAKENKSIDGCCDYILGEARKRGNAVAMSDTEVFGMAVHYYDEDDIKTNKLPAGTRVSAGKSQAGKPNVSSRKGAKGDATEITEVKSMSLF